MRRGLEIADAEGLDAVSFRRLAAEFGVTPMALYRHVADREDLLAAMTDLVLAQIPVPDDPGQDWATTLRGVLRNAVAVYDRHPAARALSAAGRWSPQSLVLTEQLITLLTAAGFSAGESFVLVQRLGDAALVETWQLPGGALPGFPGLEAAMQDAAPEDPRAFGIDLTIAGAQSVLAARDGSHRGR